MLTRVVSLTRFKRLLVKTRHEVRRLAHTLHIPPAQPEFYGGPQTGWLKDILDRLPALQALIVSNLSFFDYQCLQICHAGHKFSLRSPARYPLKLLIASECENTTAQSLTTALAQFPDLMYLDVSGAHGARSPHVLHQIGCLPNLKVLNLSKCGLRDEDLEYLKFTNNLRSLDVSSNFLTERGISRLLEMIPSEILVTGRDRSSTMNTAHRSMKSRPHVFKAVPADGLEKFIVKRLTSSHMDHLQLEEDLPTVFTNLHVASNYITVDSLARTIQCPTLKHADLGSLNLSKRPYEMLSPRSPVSPSSVSRRFSDSPEIEVLSPAVFCHSFRNLTSLRIGHSVITSHPFSGQELPLSEQCFELHSEDLRFELDSREVHGECFEMEDTSRNVASEHESHLVMEHSDSDAQDDKDDNLDIEEIHASFESPEDVAAQLHITHPIDIDGENSRTSDETPNSVTRKLPSISITSQHNHIATSHLPGSLPDGPEVYRYNYKSGPESTWRALEQCKSPTSTRDLIEAITQRQHRTAARERHPGRFRPFMLPHLKTLTLTDVPSTTRRHHIPDTLILFIRECAEDEESARLEELACNGSSATAPHQRILKLETLILEMTSYPEPMFTSSLPHQAPRSKRSSFTKSSTEDMDSELFMNATESDFSFFGEDDGGLLVSEGRVDRPVMGYGGLMLDAGDDGHVLDVVHKLAGYRKEKKRRFEALEERDGGEGCGELVIERASLGHWRGVVRIVR